MDFNHIQLGVQAAAGQVPEVGVEKHKRSAVRVTRRKLDQKQNMLGAQLANIPDIRLVEESDLVRRRRRLEMELVVEQIGEFSPQFAINAEISFPYADD